MARPRNTSIKLVMDVPESVYMELAVKARGVGAASVGEYVENLLCLDVAKTVALPLLDPEPEVVPPAPVEAEAAPEKQKRKGK